MPLAYQELRQIAQHHWNRQPPGHTLQPTALVHEAWLKLVGQDGRNLQNRKQFFILASMAMRQVLVNHAEARLAQKRGGDARRVPVDEAHLAVDREAREVVAVHAALQSLAAADARKGRVVELRYFGGFSIEETADALGVSAVTVTRDWQSARAWLARELGKGTA